MPEFPPSCLEQYKPVKPLATGGFGTVWLARHVRLDRMVAIKVLDAARDQLTDAGRRFRDEARIAATLNHPAIVKVLDHGVDDAMPWIAYEHVDGPSLAARLARGPLSVREALTAGAHVAGALAEAHAHGVLHRDVKPENVLCAPGGAYKLTDFGIAKWREHETVKTAPDLILGSPLWLAPERIRGEQPGVASDLYALGAMLHACLTGQPPYTGSTATDLMTQHVNAPIPDLAALRPEVPPPVAALVRELLAKDPGARPASAAIVMARLEQALAASPGASAPAARALSVPVRTGWRTTAVRRLTSPTVLLALAGAAIALAVGTRYGPPPPAPSASATAPDAISLQFKHLSRRFLRAANRIVLTSEWTRLELAALPAGPKTLAQVRARIAALRLDTGELEAVLPRLGGPLEHARDGRTCASVRARTAAYSFLGWTLVKRFDAIERTLVPGEVPKFPKVDDPGTLERVRAWLPLGGVALAAACGDGTKPNDDLTELLDDFTGISGVAAALLGRNRARMEPWMSAAFDELERAPAPLGPRVLDYVRAMWAWSAREELALAEPVFRTALALRHFAPRLEHVSGLPYVGHALYKLQVWDVEDENALSRARKIVHADWFRLDELLAKQTPRMTLVKRLSGCLDDWPDDGKKWHMVVVEWRARARFLKYTVADREYQIRRLKGAAVAALGERDVPATVQRALNALEIPLSEELGEAFLDHARHAARAFRAAALREPGGTPNLNALLSEAARISKHFARSRPLPRAYAEARRIWFDEICTQPGVAGAELGRVVRALITLGESGDPTLVRQLTDEPARIARALELDDSQRIAIENIITTFRGSASGSPSPAPSPGPASASPAPAPERPPGR